jgi:hypothetical protein
VGHGTLLYQGLAMTEEEFWAILYDVPPIMAPIYRLYYNDQGEPLFYSMEDRPGNYIDIDQETFARSPSHVRVKDGKLIHVSLKNIVKKLVPGNVGTACDPRDVCVVVEESIGPNTKWSLKNNETN